MGSRLVTEVDVYATISLPLLKIETGDGKKKKNHKEKTNQGKHLMPSFIWAERDDAPSVTMGAEGVLLWMTFSCEGTKTIQQHLRWSYSYFCLLEALHTARLQTSRKEN